MSEENSKMFSLMVVSQTPEEVVKKYDAGLKVEPYVKYVYKDVGKYRKKSIKMSQDIIDNAEKLGCSEFMIDYFKEKVRNLSKITDFEYYASITDGLTFDEEGNALSDENPDGKWVSCNIGRNLCIPLLLKSGGEVLQARAGDVDWEKMRMVDVPYQTIVWQLFHKEREPQNKHEEQIYENIKYQKKYFEGFDSMEDYIAYSCSYWCYAYADDEKWVDADDYKNYEWITSFYDRFVSKLKDDDLVSIYECCKP